MAKIDVATIEGYADMTPEQKLAALENYEYDLSKFIKKETFDKTASETAEWKRKYNALAAEKGTVESDAAQKMAALEEQVAEMTKKTKVADAKAKYLTVGYDESLAEATAVALIDNDIEVVFANQKKFIEEREKQLRGELLKNMPRPPAGQDQDKAMTKEEFRKLSLMKRQQLSEKNPELYKKLTEV